MAQTDLITLLADELKKVLGLESSFELDMDEEFAQYGMNSIVSARYSHVLSESLGQEISPKVLVEYSTMARLSSYLEEQNITVSGLKPQSAPAKSPSETAPVKAETNQVTEKVTSKETNKKEAIHAWNTRPIIRELAPKCH